MTTKTSSVSSYRFVRTRNVPYDDPLPSAGWSYHWIISQRASNSVTSAGSVPSYKERIANYQSATTPLSGVRWEFDEPDYGNILVKRYSTASPFIRGGIESDGHFSAIALDPPDPSTFIIQSVANQVTMQLVSQIRSANTSLKGLVSLGELGETVRMVNSAGKQIFSTSHGYLNDVANIIRTPGSPKEILRRVSRRWLEYAFGWRPLVADIDDGIRAIRRIRAGRPPRVLVRASSRSTEKLPSIVTPYNTNDYTITVTSERRLSYGMRLYGCVSLNSGVEGVAHEFGIKLDEFVPTIWELIPYSFLADYFVNIGAIIDYYSLNTSGIRWLNKGQMSEGEILSTAVPTFNKVTGWTYTTNSVRMSRPFRITRRTVSREATSYSALPLSLQFKIPGSGTQWLNIAALVAQHERTSRDLRSRLRM